MIYRENLMKAIDQDKSGTVDFKEFSVMFSDIEQYNTLNETSKTRYN
jgi:Ca2+-binding EF-hand superfamily protein